MELSLAAAETIVSHTSYHSLTDCLGLLLGKGLSVSEAVPLSHNVLLGSASVTALAMIESYLKRLKAEGEKAELDILGVYYFTNPDAITSSDDWKVSEVVPVRDLIDPLLQKQDNALLLYSVSSEPREWSGLKVGKSGESSEVKLKWEDEVLRKAEAVVAEGKYDGRDLERFLVDPLLTFPLGPRRVV